MNVKRLFNLGMAMLLLVTSFAVSQPVAAEAPMKFTPRVPAGAEYVPGEVVVTFADSQDKSLVEKIEQAVDTANDAGGEVTRLSLDGSAVIQVEGDPTAALAELNEQPDVASAELNYIFSVPTAQGDTEESTTDSDYVIREVAPSVSTNGMSVMAIPRVTAQGMVAMGTLPSDMYLLNTQGWYSVGGDIVWPNNTASAKVCEIDTGVDTLHPDFKYTKVVSGVTKTFYRVTSGYDFVNGDTNAADDNGHGTHVAGIIAAVKNNKIGVSGLSTGDVIAVKALDAQGWGTTFDIAKAIKYCADRSDIRVINLSLGGPFPSPMIENALIYATTPTTDPVPDMPGVKGKGKLVVVAAGNKNVTTPTYPAAYAVDNVNFPNNRILSVGATGKGSDPENLCKSTTSNYGGWVTVMAPGYYIYSTTPYDKPFYLNYLNGEETVGGYVSTRYDYMSGTSMAAAFVSAAAARRMGYKPADTNETVGGLVISTGALMDSIKPNCTPSEIQSLRRVNVAALLDRAAVRASVFDALSGVPLNGATVAVNYMFNGVSTTKTAVIAPDTYKADLYDDVDPNRIITEYNPIVDIFDVPTKNTNGTPVSNYKISVSKTGYTVGYQQVFRQYDLSSLTAGLPNYFVNGAVPPLTKEFNVVLGWNRWQQPGFKLALSPDDLDLYVWLPDTSLVAQKDPAQPAPFIVGYWGVATWGDPPIEYVENDSYGTMTDFPFARLKRDGGMDGGPTVEATTILQRVPRSGGTVAANAALPYYAGGYTIMVTDFGQTIDHDNDGCGDNYSYGYMPVDEDGGTTPAGYYDPADDPDCPPNDAIGTMGIPLIGAYLTPYVYVWKDGVVKYFQTSTDGFGPWDDEVKPTTDLAENCNDHWWKAFKIFTTTTSTAPVYDDFATVGGNPLCDDGAAPGFVPYASYANWDNPLNRIIISGK